MGRWIVFLSVFSSYFFFFSFLDPIFSNPTSARTTKPLVVISVDGLPAEYLSESSELWQSLPNFKRLKEGSHFFSRISSVNPSITYPSHTSMMTGVDPALHGIQGNVPFDPFYQNRGGWMWYSEDIRVPTLWDHAIKKGLVVGNVFWPVTVGSGIQWNLPQYWRERIPEDDKLLRALSTSGLHREMEKAVGKPLNETTGDETKFLTAIQLFQRKNPDLLLLYTTDLDSAHHAHGLYSEKAIAKLQEIDGLFGRFMEELNLWDNPSANIILTSDHGFRSSQNMCYPNTILVLDKYIDPIQKKFQAYFRSLGGLSVLNANQSLENPSKEFLLKWKTQLESGCPGVQFVFSGKEFYRLQREVDRKAIGFLVSDGRSYFSSSLDEKSISVAKKDFFSHGFERTQAEMETVGFVYPKTRSLPRELKSVKDVFHLSLYLLGI